MIMAKVSPSEGLSLIFAMIIEAGGRNEGRDPSGSRPACCPSGGGQRSTVPAMKSSTAALAAESEYCTGGDFMK